MSSSKRKSEFLGMSHGTASNRLRKNIMFDLVCRLGENVCFRCGGLIESPSDLSVEHIEAWENVSTDLFWDLNNIAFSHITCNSVSHKPRTGIIDDLPDDKSYCYGCNEVMDLSNFGKNASRKNGISIYCKPCKSSENKRNRKK